MGKFVRSHKVMGQTLRVWEYLSGRGGGGGTKQRTEER